MKKIYTLAKVLILSAILQSEALAQAPVCPSGSAAPFNIILSNGQTSCVVNIARSPRIGARIVVYNAAGQEINLKTPSNLEGKYFITQTPDEPAGVGSGTAAYICGETVFRIRLIIEDLNTPPFVFIYDIENSAGNTCIFNAVDIDLPIKLSKFNATLKGASTVNLTWTSTYEMNSLEFGVEKSVDGKTFSTIGKVAAKGESYSDVNYGFEDNQLSGAAFYRLKLTDIDGKFEYSKVVYVNNGRGGTTTLSVFPNPFKSDIQLKGVSASEINSQNVKVYNVAGKQVGYRITGSNSISIDASLPQGVYILRVKDQNYKLIKE